MSEPKAAAPGIPEHLVARVRRAAAGYQDKVVQFLRDVIAIPSESTREKDVVHRIAGEMHKNGFDEVFFDKVGNVVGRVGSGPFIMIYDSHIDTVGIADPTAWEVDPYKGKLEHGTIYGRGASDNKAAIATMVYAARVIKDLGLDDLCTLYVVGVVEEEACDGWAIKEFIEQELIGARGVKPDAVILGECTGLDIYRGHRGRIEFKVVTKGISCHASAPERGENAIYKMQRIIAGIEAMAPKLAYDEFLGKGTIAVTKIECKTGSLNVVPDECTIYIDRRTTVGETKESCFAEIRSLPGAEDAIIEILFYEDPSWTGYSKKVEKYFPSWVLPEDHPLVQAGAVAAEAVLGRRPGVSKWVFGTDGCTTMGKLGIPTIGFGPSEERWAHTAKDQCPVEHLARAVEFYALLPVAMSAHR